MYAGSFGLIGGNLQVGFPYKNASSSSSEMHPSADGISVPSINGNVSGSGMNIEQGTPMLQTGHVFMRNVM